MQIEQRDVSIRDLANGYADDGEGGVRGLSGTLDIRPPFQREFVYKDKQRNAVIETVMQHFPLNVMYFAVRDDGTFEVMDGQQRTISICQYVTGEYSINQRSFANLPQDKQDEILDYKLLVYFCEGTPSEKLDWFRTINIAGERLTDQELRNAVYHGPWVTDAKKWFSRTAGPAVVAGENYVTGSAIRQELLETALKWICLRDDLDFIESYMDKVRSQPNATELWTYFQQVISWAKSTFPVTRKQLTAVRWGELYKKHGSNFPDGNALEQRVSELMSDEDVENKVGIYSYVLDNDERHLTIRAFNTKQRTEAFERQKGFCSNPSLSGHSQQQKFDIDQMEADHITPWSKGGATTSENCQMLCRDCNRRKGSI
jgi:hypothetical protein